MARKMYLVTTVGGAVNWSTTRTAIMENAAKFQECLFNFGPGAEAAFRCPGCGRLLPMVLAHLDHIYPKSRYAQMNLGLLNDSNFVLLSRVLAPINKSGGRFSNDELGLGKPNADGAKGGRAIGVGGYATISVGSVYNAKTANVSATQIWENDLRNLQLLCSQCNTSKGDKTFVDWKGEGVEALPLARALKDAYVAEMAAMEE
jgi:hypothetical protein